MAAGVDNSALLDLIATTTKNLPSGEFEVALEYQNYEVMDRWFRGDRKEVDSGTSVQRNIILDASGNATYVLLNQRTAINIVNVMSQLDVPWTQAQVFWAVERREVLRNRKPARFVELLKGRRTEAWCALANILEERAWEAPDSSTDTLHPYGIPYWVPQLASGAGEGFYGGSASGFTSTAGIDPATSGDNTTSIAGGKPKWRSYCAGGTGYYESVNRTAIKTMRKLFRSINFQAPFVARDIVKGPLAKYRIYMNNDTIGEYEDYAESKNDKLGRDLVPFYGVTAFKRTPIIYVAQLDDDTLDPVYFINHNKFKPFVLSGDYLREDGPYKDVEQHNTFVTFVDLSHAFVCLNRREQGAMNKIA